MLRYSFQIYIYMRERERERERERICSFFKLTHMQINVANEVIMIKSTSEFMN